MVKRDILVLPEVWEAQDNKAYRELWDKLDQREQLELDQQETLDARDQMEKRVQQDLPDRPANRGR